VGIRTAPDPGSAAAVPSPAANAFGWPAGRRLSRTGQAVLALTVAAAVLRFATLDVQSIWLDESATMLLVRRGFAGMLSHLSASESAPPLYYVLVWAWTKVFGLGVIGFRSFSALVGTLTIPVMYLAGRRVSERVGLWAAALATVNPAMYYYSQEARCYALLIFFSAIAFVFWQHALENPDKRRLALWAGASILAVLTHYFAAFLFIPEAIVLIRRYGLRRLLVPAGAVVLVGLALMPLAVAQHGNGHKSEWIEESSLISRVAETAKQFLVGLYSPLEIFTALTGGLLAAGALVLVIRRTSQAERRVARDVAIVAAAALALPLALALSHALDVFDGRNMIADWVPAALLIAIGLGASGARRAGTSIGVCLCILFLGVVVSVNLIPDYQRDNWRGAAQALPSRRSPDQIIVAEGSSWYPLSVYLPGARPLTGATLSTRELDFIALRARRTGHSPVPPVVPNRPPRGFRLVSVRDTESYAVTRFLAPRATTVSLATLRQLSREPYAEAIQQR
jgi:mannosyltransferase